MLPSSAKHPGNQTTISSMAGELITETFGYDGGRQVTVYRPIRPRQSCSPVTVS